MDWSLLACGRGGHVTYAPDEPALRSRLTAQTPSGEAWRCLRCGTFVIGPPGGNGPAVAAPQVRRGKELRSALHPADLRHRAVRPGPGDRRGGVRRLAAQLFPYLARARVRACPAGRTQALPGSGLQLQPVQAHRAGQPCPAAELAHARLPGHRAGRVRDHRDRRGRRALAAGALGRVLRDGGDLDLPALRGLRPDREVHRAAAADPPGQPGPGGLPGGVQAAVRRARRQEGLRGAAAGGLDPGRRGAGGGGAAPGRETGSARTARGPVSPGRWPARPGGRSVPAGEPAPPAGGAQAGTDGSVTADRGAPGPPA